ncbi:hypothetical protein B0O99DRAFT_600225 [Bisporella sp. PMI_857]|nr:hypothetical protein B0O99DRAFT_600225 [Bisporella sp. PMI_857]
MTGFRITDGSDYIILNRKTGMVLRPGNQMEDPVEIGDSENRREPSDAWKIWTLDNNTTVAFKVIADASMGPDPELYLSSSLGGGVFTRGKLSGDAFDSDYQVWYINTVGQSGNNSGTLQSDNGINVHCTIPYGGHGEHWELVRASSSDLIERVEEDEENDLEGEDEERGEDTTDEEDDE